MSAARIILLFSELSANYWWRKVIRRNSFCASPCRCPRAGKSPTHEGRAIKLIRACSCPSISSTYLKVSLLAEFAAPFERGRPPAYSSAFLRFLRGSGFAPWEAALRECGKRRPPLYDEMAYVLGRMGDTRRALTILLEVRRPRR